MLELDVPFLLALLGSCLLATCVVAHLNHIQCVGCGSPLLLVLVLCLWPVRCCWW
jgi:hypothetical protein